MSRPHAAPDLIAQMPAPAGPQCAIVLKPLSRPELGEIHIDDNLFAVGRGESPFASYAADAVAELSRRHARIFSEHGVAYLADLGSKNGTSVNGARISQKIAILHDGDQLCFGRTLSYQVQIQSKEAGPAPQATIRSVTLSPERQDLGLQPVVITEFPFLISKADPRFAQYRDAYPHQVNYLSRRHAHIFLKGGVPLIEDLGSTNGTFIGGKRLNEQAVALEDGVTVGFGGHHFVYKLSLQWLAAQADPTVTQFALPAAGGAPGQGEDKTTFVASAGSFLDIFCIEQAPQQADELNAEVSRPEAGKGSESSSKLSRSASLLSALLQALGGSDQAAQARAMRWAMAAFALLSVLIGAIYLNDAPEREVRDLLASAQYMRAASLASRQLQRTPDDAAARALATEALLKAVVPDWTRAIKAGQFERATAQLADMRRLSAHNPDAQAIARELEWITGVEQFVAARGGADRPIAHPADAQGIKLILKQWGDDTQGQQRAFATVSAYVPEFKDTYASALSHVRKLALLGGRDGDE